MFESITKHFRKKPNPTADWPPARPQELVYDLRARSVNGLALDGPLDRAKQFGPSESFNRLDEFLDLYFRARGLALEFGDDQLIGVVFVFSEASDHAQKHQLQPGSACIVDLEGRSHRLGGTSRLEEVVACFGQPFDTMQFNPGTGCTFKTGKNIIEAEFDAQGRLLQLDICGAAEN